ncbi:hypothetical protein CDL15_Pgr022223 [Punica granatum]|uniref:Pentatricopeptide repeat-containing protein n=1 Tax=Punica granatum TaxID=22663 RepID=A0A218WPN3_PUNGR|nr:hypothetical protein CDL15_Pgr022223 [Punica granatum]
MPTSNATFPPKILNRNTNFFVSTKHRPLALLNLCSSLAHLWGLSPEPFLPAVQLARSAATNDPSYDAGAIITACIENTWVSDGIYFLKMRDRGFERDERSIVVLLSACVEMGSLGLGRWPMRPLPR